MKKFINICHIPICFIKNVNYYYLSIKKLINSIQLFNTHGQCIKIVINFKLLKFITFYIVRLDN